ncbi:MAG: 4-alpha-glucanotransferase [Elusimicrobia bacterium]|nr:4-alpha-glucanotransferase [Elusimicrobiota bacterium]
MHPLLKTKKVGLLLPLFSMRSVRDWGTGDFSSMRGWLDVLHSAGLTILQVLPLNEMPPGVNCPYTALSAFALDPVYLDPCALPELAEAPEAAAYMESREFKARLAALRASKQTLYDDIRALKHETLWRVFTAFHKHHVLGGTPEGKAFEAFCSKNAYWLEDYALFRRLKDVHRWISWTHWPGPLSAREPSAVAAAAAEHGLETVFFKYLQWCVQRQWRQARQRAAELGISLFGDLPFMVNQESADIWSRQPEFDISLSIGAPPDTWTPEGQKWGLPAYNWDVAEATGFEWWKLKLRRAEELYDIYRIDHMVGFFRTWIVPEDKRLKPHFDIEGDRAQEDRGRRFLKALTSSSRMLAVGEDLGLIPPYVGKVLAEAGVPGYKVLRWEKTGDDYADPADFPKVSLATTSTHDTEQLAAWWKSAGPKERRLFWKMVSGRDGKPPAFAKALDPLLRKMIAGGSRVVILPYQDLFGIPDRINTPNTVGPHNWSFRPDVPLEQFQQKHGDRLRQLASWIREAR